MANGVSTREKVGFALRFIAVWGPGLLVMLADTDAGNIVTAAQAGARWGYRLLPLLLLLIAPLYMVQELTVRLGIYTGRGFSELIRERFGAGWAWLCAGGLAIATLSSLVTEFTAVAGIGEMYGVPRSLTLPLSCALLVYVVTTGSYRRIERVAMVVGMFELAFFAVAWSARPDHAIMVRHVLQMPFGDRTFLYLMAALIGAVFNPWMVFYQQSSIVEKRLSGNDYRAARWETAFGALLTQALTGAVLVASAATLGGANAPVPLKSVGDISLALEPMLGLNMARLVFSGGVLGAALVAAIVASLAIAWGVGELIGYHHSLGDDPMKAKGFYGVYVACTVGSAALVWRAHDLVSLNIGAQVVNVFLLPMVLAFLVSLSGTALQGAQRLHGGYRVVLVILCCLICILGLVGALSQL